MQIQNPVLDDIKQNYMDIYQKCLNVSKVLERFTGKPVPEEDVHRRLLKAIQRKDMEACRQCYVEMFAVFE